DDDVLAQGAEHERLVEGGGPGGDHTDGLVAHLPAVAEGAVHEVRAPVRGQARDLGQLVADARGDQQSAGGEGAAIGEGEGEAQGRVGRRLGGAGGGDLAGDDQAAVLAHLGPAAGEVLRRRRALVAEEAVDALGRGVAGRAGVDDDHAAAGAGEHQRAAEAGGPAPDHGDVDDGGGELIGGGAAVGGGLQVGGSHGVSSRCGGL